MHGSPNEARAAWLRYSERARKAMWLILRGRMRNPIPGIDDWRMCNERDRRATTRIGNLTPSEGEGVIQNLRPGQIRRGRTGGRRREEVSVKFLSTNCYFFKRAGFEGVLEIEFFHGANVTASYQHGRVERGHYASGQAESELSQTPYSLYSSY
jgi:hypothetical protein